MDEPLKEFVNPDQPFGPISTPTISNYQAFSSLLDTNNEISRELNKRPSLIIGRRGSGKTAFLNSLALDRRYSVIVALEPGDAFPSMIRNIERKLPSNIMAEEAAKLWHALLWGAVFQQLLVCHPAHSAAELLPVAHYLEGLGIKPGMSFYAVMRAILGAIANLNKRVKILVDAIEDLASRGVRFQEAHDCAESFMAKQNIKAIILMDSLEQFPLDEPAMAKAMTGLLRCVGQFNQPGRPCELRCCLPSELYPRLIDLSAAPLKDFASRTVLQWRSHELLHLAALRYSTFIRLYYPEGWRRCFARLDLSRRDDVRLFWAEILPDKVTNRLGECEDAIAYIMRHTQLLPRHLILYLNEISKKALSTNGKSVGLDQESIIEGVRASEHILCHEIFSAFQQVHPKAQNACEGLLPNLPLTFRFGDLHREFNRNRRVLDAFEDHHEAIAILLGVGAIGVVSDETDRYTRAIFSYTLSDNLNYRADDIFCVHPIFVERHRVINHVKQEPIKPVYPAGSEVAFA